MDFPIKQCVDYFISKEENRSLSKLLKMVSPFILAFIIAVLSFGFMQVRGDGKQNERIALLEHNQKILNDDILKKLDSLLKK